MAGVQTEACTEGGLNVGWIDTNDWMAYNSINFPSSGNYRVEYRVASPSGGTLSLDLNAGTIQLGQLGVPATGGWQNWTTVSHTVNVNAGTYNLGVGNLVADAQYVYVGANANSNQRYMTLEAFQRAGFKVIGAMNEPTAAAVEFFQELLLRMKYFARSSLVTT